MPWSLILRTLFSKRMFILAHKPSTLKVISSPESFADMYPQCMGDKRPGLIQKARIKCVIPQEE